MTNPNYFLDWRGNRIEPGTIVVYAVVSSNSPLLVEGRVDNILWETQSTYDYDLMKHIDKDQPVLKITRLREADWNGGAREVEHKQVTVRCYERVIAVE